MPRYFFDVTDGREHVDEDGLEFRDLHQASREALRSLPEIAAGYATPRDSGEIAITVRDESGAAIYRASMSIRSELLASSAGL